MTPIKLVKSCKHCNENFTTSSTRKIFCSRSCKESFTTLIRRENAKKLRLKRLKAKETLLNGSAFARYLVTEAKRAGTLEIFHGITSNDLLELLKITRNRTKYNGIFKGKVERRYEVSHIIAVKDQSRLGLLHPLNMVIAPASFNRKRGSYSSALDVGLSLSRNQLKSKYRVDRHEDFSTVFRRIKRYLGKATIESFLSEAKVYLSQRNQLLKKLSKFPNLPDVSKLSTEDLHLLLQAEGVSSSASFSRAGFSALKVAYLELDRFNKTDSVIYWVLEALVIRSENRFSERLCSCIPTVSEVHLIEFVLIQAWSLLHGDPYELFFNGQHLIECFEVDSFSTPKIKLDQVIFDRSTFKLLA